MTDSSSDGLDVTAPNWLLMLYTEARCTKCDHILEQDYPLLSEIFHEKDSVEKEHQYIIGKVRCDDPMSTKVCKYFGILEVPMFVVLRPAESFYYFWPEAHKVTREGLADFARVGYKDALL